ncbi:uncharacterized protein METZ01_LOCUS113279, partial [marine metagenome]
MEPNYLTFTVKFVIIIVYHEVKIMQIKCTGGTKNQK